LALRPSVFDSDVLTLNITSFIQATSECVQTETVRLRRPGAEIANHRHRPLRARRERPRGRSTEQRDELAAPHSITSSGGASRVGGFCRPSPVAVFTLRTSSSLVGCSTGRSLGLAPFKILSTYTAARRYISE